MQQETAHGTPYFYRTTRKFRVTPPGVTEDAVLLQTLMSASFDTGYLTMVSIPEELGLYPVVDVGSALKSARKSSVVRRPEAEPETTVAQAPEAISEVPSDTVPLATV